MGAVHIARRGAAAFLTAVGKSHEAHQFELKDFVAQANKVTVLGYQMGQAEPIGRPYEIEFVHLWSVRDGKFTEFRVIKDTAALVVALRP